MGKNSHYEDNTASGKYSKEGLEMELELTGDQIILVKEKKSILTKVPLKQFKILIEKIKGRELNDAELGFELSKYQAIVDLEATFTANPGSIYHYGADADGNRGEDRWDYDDVEELDELKKAELRFVDENGDTLGGEDSFVDLGDNDDVEEYILDDINSNMSDYL